MKKKKVIITVCVIAAVVIGGVIVKKTLFTKNASTDMVMEDEYMGTDYVTLQDISNAISVSGKIESTNEVNITSTLSQAKVKTVNVAVGDMVKAGDVLCEFDSASIQAEYDTLKAALDTANAQVANTNAVNQRNLEDAKAQRAEDIEAANLAHNRAIAARDKAYADYNQLKAQMDAETELETKAALKAQCDEMAAGLTAYDDAVTEAANNIKSVTRQGDNAVMAAQDIVNAEKYVKADTESLTQLEKLQTQLNNCKVTASIDGVVTALNVKPGSIPTTEAIMTISDTKSLKINVSINESDILKVNENMPVTIKTPATGDRVYNGIVKKVVKVPGSASDMGMMDGGSGTGYSAEISITDNDEKVLIGMTANAKVVLADKTDALTVPYDSVVTEDGKDYIFLVEESGGQRVAKKTEVTKGVEDNYYTEVISDEVSEGMEVVTSAEFVEDGEIIE